MGTSEQSESPPDAPPPSREAILVLDAAVGASVLAAAAARAVGRRVGGALSPVRDRVGGAVRPVVVVVLRPPMLSERYQAATWLERLAERGGQGRAELERQLSVVLDRLVPAVAAEVVKRIDMAAMADGVIAEVDLAEIIRQATGPAASGTVPGDGTHAMPGDEPVGRVVARLRLRRDATEPEMTSTQP